MAKARRRLTPKCPIEEGTSVVTFTFADVRAYFTVSLKTSVACAIETTRCVGTRGVGMARSKQGATFIDVCEEDKRKKLLAKRKPQDSNGPGHRKRAANAGANAGNANNLAQTSTASTSQGKTVF